MMDTCINAAVFIITAVSTASFFRRDHKWRLSNGVVAFRYFTVQSNILCAVAALLMCAAPSQPWVWTLKYIGTVAVTVTMLTVFVFLGPNLGYKPLLSGTELYMHLITPVLAILSFFVFEKRGLPFRLSLLGMLPVFMYSFLYLYKVIYAPEDKRWEDFYAFNKGGKWPISMAAMLLGNFILCIVFRFLQNV